MKKPIIYKLGEEKFEICDKITSEYARFLIIKLTEMLYSSLHNTAFLLDVERAILEKNKHLGII